MFYKFCILIQIVLFANTHDGFYGFVLKNS